MRATFFHPHKFYLILIVREKVNLFMYSLHWLCSISCPTKQAVLYIYIYICTGDNK